MSNKDGYKIFPFCPKVSWLLRNGKYIYPKINSAAWNSVIESRTLVVGAFGGLIETFFSFSILEALNKNYPNLKLLWAGQEKFQFLLKMTGLAEYYPDINQNILLRFPSPVFLDRRDKTYFNCLNNYLNVFAYYGEFGYCDHRPLLQQIFEKSLLEWDINYLPKLRNNHDCKNIHDYCKLNKLDLKSPYVLLIPEQTSLSQHNISTLNWSDTQIKALAAMLKIKGINLIVLTENVSLYLNSPVHALPFKLEDFFGLIPEAKAILSREIDYLLIANLISNAMILSLPTKAAFSLDANNKFLHNSNVIYTEKSLTPLQAYQNILGIS